MGKEAPSAPAPPDPVKTVQAQAKALPSSFTPYGSSVFSGDPSKGTFQQTQAYSSAVQPRFEASNRLATALLGQGEAKAPGLAQPFQFDPNNPTTNQYWSAQKNLLDEVFGRQGEQLDQKLANQGIPLGSEAFSDATGDLARQQASGYEQASANALQQGFGQSLASRQQLEGEVARALQQGAPPSVGGGGGAGGVDVNEALAAQQAGVNRQYQGELAGYNANTANTNTAIAGVATIAAAIL